MKIEIKFQTLKQNLQKFYYDLKRSFWLIFIRNLRPLKTCIFATRCWIYINIFIFDFFTYETSKKWRAVNNYIENYILNN